MPTIFANLFFCWMTAILLANFLCRLLLGRPAVSAYGPENVVLVGLTLLCALPAVVFNSARLAADRQSATWANYYRPSAVATCVVATIVFGVLFSITLQMLQV